jgi:hypothetical protein
MSRAPLGSIRATQLAAHHGMAVDVLHCGWLGCTGPFTFRAQDVGPRPALVAYAVIGLVATLGYTFIGVRTFRGYLEPSAPPRDWWRWSGRPKAGFWLGALYAVATLEGLQNFWPGDGVAFNYPLAILTTLSSAVVAIGYFNVVPRPTAPRPLVTTQSQGEARRDRRTLERRLRPSNTTASWPPTRSSWASACGR